MNLATTNTILSDHQHVTNRLSYNENLEALQCAQKVLKHLMRHEDNRLRNYQSNIAVLRNIIDQHEQKLEELRTGILEVS